MYNFGTDYLLVVKKLFKKSVMAGLTRYPLKTGCFLSVDCGFSLCYACNDIFVLNIF